MNMNQERMGIRLLRIHRELLQLQWNCSNKNRISDSTYYTKRLMLVQQEEAEIHLTAEKHDFLSYASDEEREEWELTTNYLFMTKLQSTSLNMDIAPINDTDGISKMATEEIIVLVKNLLIPLAKKKKENAYAFESALKTEMFKDLEYTQSLEKEVDKL
ncbi:hypothetical protein Tco_0937198 [Tanacetum coccineum]|uniref:Uncharacterized protein n=1 Tax=Tanacetum coccineum TaxID=301880 RepID=A0ABQ5DGC5_9ASTR